MGGLAATGATGESRASAIANAKIAPVIVFMMTLSLLTKNYFSGNLTRLVDRLSWEYRMSVPKWGNRMGI